MTRLQRFKRPYWVGSLEPWGIIGVSDIIQKNTVAFSGSSFHSLSPAHPSDTAPPNSNLQSEMKKSLLEILKMALRTTNGKLNIENLNLSFRKEDRSFSGYLSPPKVNKIRFQICSSLKGYLGSLGL